MTTKYCNSSNKGLWGAVSRRTRDYLREFIGGSEVKTALEKLQHLTNAELLAAVAHNNAIARALQPKIDSVANTVGRVAGQAVLRGLREWLQPPNAQPLNSAKKRRLDSCGWFFDDDKWESWMAQRNGVYWIYGNAGAGKSVLCSSIIEKLKQDSAFPLVYFYFDFSDNAKQDCRSLAASLVFQLAACSEACQGYLQRQQTTTSPTYDELLVMLSNLMKLAGHVFIVIDALDECPEQERDRGSARFLEHLCELDSNEKDFHLLVTSRPEADIWVLMSSVTHILSLNDARQHQEDVSAFIASRLDRDEHHWAPDVKDKIRKALITRSNGMFLWVDLQLLRLRDCISSADVEGTLDELPSDLNDTYTRILQRSNPSQASVERRRRVFQCIASAKRPLFLSQVIEIYCMNFNSRTPLVPIQDCERFILEKCPGLLNIVDWTDWNDAQHRIVQFIHFSAKEYLTSTDHLESTTAPAHRYSFDDYSANLTLAKICLSALQVDIDTPPLSLRAYADCYWAKHVSSRNEDDLGDLLDAFLQIDSPSFARWSGPGSEHGQDTAFHHSVRLNLCHHAERIMAQILSDPSAPNQSLLTIPDRYGRSALHVAASLRHVEMCHLLLSHGALVNSTDRDGDTPVHNAASEGHSDIVRVLLEHPAADGADPTARSRVRKENGKTPLHYAASEGHADVCRLLLSHGALVDDSDECGATPVHEAAREGHSDVVRMLLEHPAADGADPTARCRARNEDGQTPLHDAASWAHVDVCRLLLSHGALVDDTDKDGNTPVHDAAARGYLYVARLLLEHPAADGADPTVRCRARNEDGQTPLHKAASRGLADVCRLLLSHGALVDDSDECGATPVHEAAREGHSDVVRMLLEHPAADGADPTARCRARNKRGLSPLHEAARWGHADVCRLLFSHGALVDDTDGDGDTPVHIAASERCSNIVRILLEHPATDGADSTARCRARNMDGQTPLHKAAYMGSADVCRLLLSHGALVDDTDEYGDTPVHRAEQGKEPGIVRILLEHRAKDTPQVLPRTRRLRENLRERAEVWPKGPWGAILEDFASQLEDPADESD
ncbi:unnamed protein product [Peniophora sp. CBMAI 1063]|nr:unnamed protein product [Peniophora sp. CBMAI 1063]